MMQATPISHVIKFDLIPFIFAPTISFRGVFQKQPSLSATRDDEHVRSLAAWNRIKSMEPAFFLHHCLNQKLQSQI